MQYNTKETVKSTVQCPLDPRAFVTNAAWIKSLPVDQQGQANTLKKDMYTFNDTELTPSDPVNFVFQDGNNFVFQDGNNLIFN